MTHSFVFYYTLIVLYVSSFIIQDYNFINVIKKYTIIDKLDAAILNELIDKIVVHHKEQAEDGRTFQQIEIYYRFVGKLGTENELSKAA